MKLIGMETEVEDALRAARQRQPVLFYGPTGNGKTIAAWEVARVLEKELSVPIIYIQLYPEMTKNTLLGGETIKGGSIVIEKQAVLTWGEKGAIFIVDECTHTTEPVLLAFNSLIEEPYSTVIGDEIKELSEKTRFIFCGNLPDHAGNIHLPVSFANRLYIVSTGLPSVKTMCLIGRAANEEAPEVILRFVAEIIEKTHEASFPISPRNMVTVSRALGGILGSGYEQNAAIDTELDKACKEHDIHFDALKRVILSSLMAHITGHSQGPDKVAALLW